MKSDFGFVTTNDAQAMRGSLPAELGDVNGGLVFNYCTEPYPWLTQAPLGGQPHNPVLPVVTQPAGQPLVPPFTTPS
jgi:hypothetical protein